jgi:hypothetical protein
MKKAILMLVMLAGGALAGNCSPSYNTSTVYTSRPCGLWWLGNTTYQSGTYTHYEPVCSDKSAFNGPTTWGACS